MMKRLNTSDAVAEHVKMQVNFHWLNSVEYAKLAKIEELGQEDVPQLKVIEILLHDFKYMKDQAAVSVKLLMKKITSCLSNMMEDHVEYYVKQIWFIESMLK